MKTCNICKIDKELSQYCKNKRHEDGLDRKCKSCRAEYRKNIYSHTKAYNTKYRKENADKINAYKRKYRLANIENQRAKKREDYKKNKEKFNRHYKKYYDKNKKKISAKQLEYRNHRYNTDPMFKLVYNLRTRMRKAIKANGLIKDKKSLDLLGADINTVRCHIESQFASWMSWENHGTHTWHIDHIVPLSSAKTLEEMYALCHYTNLQPLAALENMRKSNKIIVPPPRHAPE